MMEYTGEYYYRWSEVAGEEVAVLKYADKEHRLKNSRICYEHCSRCGRPIKNVMYVVQSKETDVELFYLGSECIKKLT